MVLTGCTQSQTQPQIQPQPSETARGPEAELPANTLVWKDDIPEYASLDDVALLAHVEDLIYRETVLSLNSEEYSLKMSAQFIFRKNIWKKLRSTLKQIFISDTHWLNWTNCFKGHAIFSLWAKMGKPLSKSFRRSKMYLLKRCSKMSLLEQVSFWFV